MRIIVDADACPRTVLNICLQVAQDLNISLLTIASFNHVLASPHHLVVGDGPEEVDLKVMNLATRGDVVVTQDIGLAAVVVAKGAKALSPVGNDFAAADMSMLLEAREAKAKLRRSGLRTKGPPKRTAFDDARFRLVLLRLLGKG